MNFIALQAKSNQVPPCKQIMLELFSEIITLFKNIFHLLTFERVFGL